MMAANSFFKVPRYCARHEYGRRGRGREGEKTALMFDDASEKGGGCDGVYFGSIESLLLGVQACCGGLLHSGCYTPYTVAYTPSNSQVTPTFSSTYLRHLLVFAKLPS